MLDEACANIIFPIFHFSDIFIIIITPYSCNLGYLLIQFRKVQYDKIEGLFIIKSHDVIKTKLPRGFIHIIIDIYLFNCNLLTCISATNDVFFSIHTTSHENKNTTYSIYLNLKHIENN